MSHGGYRAGAGRKAGSTNRFSKDLLEKAMKEGVLPVDYMLDVMRDESMDARTRLDAAKAAAPYVHHRLASIKIDLKATELTHEDWLASLS